MQFNIVLLQNYVYYISAECPDRKPELKLKVGPSIIKFNVLLFQVQIRKEKEYQIISCF